MTTALSTSYNDAAFYRNRKAMLVYPVIILPFVMILYALGGGGKGKRYMDQETAAGQSQTAGFNASVPNAKGGNISGREVANPAYGKAAAGQMLSTFTNIRKDTVSSSLNALPASAPAAAVNHQSSLVAGPAMVPASGVSYRSANRPSGAAVAATQSPVRNRNARGYSYNPPGAKSYYTATASDQQLDQQLRSYESTRNAPVSRTQSVTPEPAPALPSTQEQIVNDTRPANVRLSDNLTASRLQDAVEAENPFHTAPTEGSRRNPERAVLSGSNSYGSKKTIAWLIPVVIHDDQAVKSGNSVKLRLLKEVSADGVTIPANTILHAVCQLDNDRLRMTVRNVQLGGQLIPLDLEVYDLDGSPGVNMPGIFNQVGGQIQSSAIQGVQLPGVGGLINGVASAARMSASNTARQTTLRLRGGYNLYLKAQ